MWISAETLSRAFHRKAAHSLEDHERVGDEEAARAVGGRMERRRSNQINKLSTEELHGKSKQDIIDELKRKYDSNNDGIFQDEEVDEMLLDTIELCEMKDNLEVEKSMMLNKLRKMNRRMKFMGGTGVVAIVASVLGTYYGSESTFSQGTLEVKDSISKSQVTSIGLDNTGHSHLKDVQTGLDVSTRSVGDSFFSRTVIDERGRKLKCIDLRFVAELYHDSVARTEASVVLVNEDGVEEQVVPINGQFVDNGRTLSFGKGADDSVTMIMDSDVCNNGTEDVFQGEDVAYELDVDAAAQDAKEVEGNETADSLPSPFDRHLLRSPQDVDDSPVADPSARVQVVDKSASRSHKSFRQLDTSRILQRNRDEYFQHREAIANGRALTTSGSVQMCTDDCPSNVALNKATDQSSTPGGGYASYVVDGDRTTNSHTGCTGDQWWEVDLGMMYDINRINVVHRQTGSAYTLRRLRNFYVRFYDDAQEKNQVYEIYQGDHVQEKAWDVNVSAQFVKLFMPAKSSNCLHLAEFEVFGTEATQEYSPFVEVDDSGSFVGWLPCTESYVDGGNIVENAIDFMFAPLENSPLNNMESAGGSVNLVDVMKEELNNAISDEFGFNVLLPQKVCADSEEDVATRGGGAGVEACESLDMLGDTDVLAFGYYNAGWDKGICVALNDGTHTYAIGQTGILPPIKIHALEINVLAIAISITKQLTATTLNDMWDGSDDEDGLALLEELTIPGHFVMRGTGDFGLTLSSTIELALSIDATLLIDLDYANDGVSPDSNGAVDFAMMFSGEMTPTFELDVGKVDDDGEPQPLELDFSAVFQVAADFYMYVNKDYKHVQLAVSRTLNLVEICEVNPVFDIFCVIFEQASFSMAMRAYANNDGFGAQFSISATMEMKDGFDIIEDLIGWPADNQVDLALDIALMGSRLRTCVMFENTRFCTGKCTNDSECDEDQACDNVFKVCRKKRDNGGKCGRDAGCISGNCVSGYCRECPTAGSTTGCTVADGKPSNYFCQRTYGLQTHVCRPQKNNGDSSGCSGNGACLSGICIGTPKICRACRNPGSVDTCTNGNVCQRNAIGAPTCGPKKNNGDASGCSSDAVCKSGVCLKGYCRACRTVASTTGCSNGEVCQNNSVGVNICAPKKSNGSTCVADSICSSGVCLNGYCRACRSPGSTTGCSSGKVCQNNSVGVNICGAKKGNGSTCVANSICSSGVCLNGYCRACRTPGSTTGCSSGNVCQNNSVGVNICGAKKNNGQTCVSNGICKSGNCVGGTGSKYCRVCTTNTHCSGQYGSSYKCYDNIKTGWIKKCCQSYCKGKGIFRTCGHLKNCKS